MFVYVLRPPEVHHEMPTILFLIFFWGELMLKFWGGLCIYPNRARNDPMYVHVYVCVHVCMYVYLCVYRCVCVFVFDCGYMYLRRYVCMHLFVAEWICRIYIYHAGVGQHKTSYLTQRNSKMNEISNISGWNELMDMYDVDFSFLPFIWYT